MTNDIYNKIFHFTIYHKLWITPIAKILAA